MAEVRVKAEGEFRWVQASGSGTAWGTGSAPPSGLIGFCESFDYSSAQRVQTISERGTPNHHKIVGTDPITVNVSFNWTGYVPTALTASGASIPMMHMEYVARESEKGITPTGRYIQFHGVAVNNIRLNEGDPSQVNMSFVALGMVGPTSTGYLG